MATMARPSSEMLERRVVADATRNGHGGRRRSVASTGRDPWMRHRSRRKATVTGRNHRKHRAARRDYDGFGRSAISANTVNVRLVEVGNSILF